MKVSSKFFINPKTEVRKSKIEGRGLFAKGIIRKGEIIHVSEGNVLTLEESNRLSEKKQNLCDQIDDFHFLCPKDFNNLTSDWYINHSCEPNCGSTKDWLSLIAMKDIEVNEEITYDYAMTDSEHDWQMKCNCRKPKCRKVISGNDWKIPELQEQYKGFFQMNIQEKIGALSDFQYCLLLFCSICFILNIINKTLTFL